MGLTRKATARIGTASKVLANKDTTTTSKIGFAHLQHQDRRSLACVMVAFTTLTCLLLGLVDYVWVSG